ncbi:MAG: L-lactate dehydrogenase [Calditrichia bacterium]
MKVGIIGSGMVGSTAAYAIMMRRVASDIVLLDANPKRAIAEAQDIQHAIPFAHATNIKAGDYPDLKDAKIIVIAAGANQKPGQSRLELMEKNATILRDIISRIAEVAPGAILIIATNPVDILTHLSVCIGKEYGFPSERIIGTGTTLDTARFRVLLGNQLGVDPHHVHAYVLGEHGDSEVLTWSNIDIGGVPLEDFIYHRKIEFNDMVKAAIDDGVRNAAYKIIEGKGSTYYGIGGAIAKLVDVINRDNRVVMTVSSYNREVEGIDHVTLSLPTVIGGEGNLGVLPIPLNAQEKSLLKNSARILREKIDEYENQKSE